MPACRMALEQRLLGRVTALNETQRLLSQTWLELKSARIEHRR